MNNYRGFSPLLLLAIIAAIGAGGFYLYKYSSVEFPGKESTDRNAYEESASPADRVPTQSPEPSITVIGFKSEGPATITIAYANLPENTSALAVCSATSDACSEWVENFRPTSPSGTYVMSVKEAFGVESKKGLAPGAQKIVVIGDNFGEQIIESLPFSVE